VPTIEQHHGGQNTPSPDDIDFTPGELLGCVSGELRLREFVEGRRHNLTVTCDKEGPDSVLDRELPEAEIVISQSFWPVGCANSVGLASIRQYPVVELRGRRS
jgi:formate dehydrogenase